MLKKIIIVIILLLIVWLFMFIFTMPVKSCCMYTVDNFLLTDYKWQEKNQFVNLRILGVNNCRCRDTVSVIFCSACGCVLILCCCLQIEFEDGSELTLKREDIWLQGETLPKKVQARLVRYVGFVFIL